MNEVGWWFWYPMSRRCVGDCAERSGNVFVGELVIVQGKSDSQRLLRMVEDCFVRRCFEGKFCSKRYSKFKWESLEAYKIVGDC